MSNEISLDELAAVLTEPYLHLEVGQVTITPFTWCVLKAITFITVTRETKCTGVGRRSQDPVPAPAAARAQKEREHGRARIYDA